MKVLMSAKTNHPLSLKQAICELCQDVFPEDAESWAEGLFSQIKESFKKECERGKLITWNISAILRLINCATKADGELKKMTSIMVEISEKRPEDKSELAQLLTTIKGRWLSLLDKIVFHSMEGLEILYRERKVATENLAWGEMLETIEKRANQLKTIVREAQQTEEDRIKPIAREAVRILGEVASLPILFAKFKVALLPESTKPEGIPKEGRDFIRRNLDNLEEFIKQTAKNAAMSKSNIKRLINQ